MSKNTVDKVIAVAEKEVGYLEKKNADMKYLYDKTKNAGSANYTKYGYEMHKIYPSVMDYPAAWCDCFVDWCFYKAYGVATAKSLLGGNFNDYTVASADMYKKHKAYIKRGSGKPKKGDQIFFRNSERICHTGIVYKVDEKNVYTIEGNTSGASGVVANGGGVKKKSYPLNSSYIDGYGRPKYDKEKDEGKKDNSTRTTHKDNTESLNKNEKRKGIVTATELNVRTYAGTEYGVCSFSPLKKGTEVSVCDTVNARDCSKWYYIKYKGAYGFASAKYIA